MDPFVVFPFDNFVEPEIAVPPTGACCACTGDPMDLVTPDQYDGDSVQYCADTDQMSLANGAGIMFAHAEKGQTCRNACVASFDPSMKETAEEEKDRLIKAQIQYGELGENEGPNAKLRDMCICSGIDDNISFVDNKILKQDELTQYTFDTYNHWLQEGSLDGVTQSGSLIGIPFDDKDITCKSACNSMMGDPVAVKESGNLEPLYIGMKSAVAGFGLQNFYHEH